MIRPPTSKTVLRALGALAFVATAAISFAGKGVTEITLPGMRVFAESITSTKNGTLIAGSLGHGIVLKIAPGKTGAAGATG